jgi:hypothetical protein
MQDESEFRLIATLVATIRLDTQAVEMMKAQGCIIIFYVP